MNQQKGFSLIEVLASLMLATTLALALTQQQWHTRLLIKQLLARTKASAFLDQINESLYLGSAQLPAAPFPCHLDIKEANHAYTIRLDWFNRSESITRQYHPLSELS
ncbi:prepilin-type N-terminal cleavage/methylation domain-containing protein [Legionella shakespearei]|uniref:Tfp pilus assembly protein PilV n=1 Tax=Legionella shakespearei DSM 23087 TaxID=1122169 RepID=A0A0W0Z8K4_9GAMM|nr:prepilin-type N-terminal cleavage/methylation domain-containing protein [Legionella shakespearei]KTD65435.1 hypothetical protein Lsha_0252 [Legionella shakespearei DSM 23087]